jgi:hypothetical protein
MAAAIIAKDRLERSFHSRYLVEILISAAGIA